MARLTGGLLGTAQGKIAGIVASTWKDVNYVRTYVKPGNPNTVAQQTQRNLMKGAVAFAKLLVGQIFNKYTDRFQRSMSGFNFFIHRNIIQFTTVPTLIMVKIAEGKLFTPPITLLTPDATTDIVTITFGTMLGNNGAPSDKVYAVAYNKTTDLIGFATAEVQRSTGTISVPLSMTPANAIYAWIFAIRYDGTLVELISNSAVVTANAA